MNLVTTHNTRNPDIYKIIRSTIAILRASSKMRKALANVDIINSIGQPHRIMQIVTRARFISIDNNKESDIQSKQKVTKCASEKCVLCPILQEHSEITFKNQDKKFEIQSEMDCTVMSFV